MSRPEIVLDPGHGGKHPGAVGRYYKTNEKDVNLSIAKRLKGLLSSRGIKVYLTREKDTFVPLSERSNFASKKDADFFISIHSNSSTSRKLRGFEVYYLSEKRMDDSKRAFEAAGDRSLDLGGASIDRNNKTAKAIAYDLKFTENRIESKDLGKHLLSAARKKNIYARKRSLKDARFHVLKNFKTDMPAVLVETGYLSNKREEGQLKSSSYRQKVAEALAKGIMAYKKQFEKQNGFTR